MFICKAMRYILFIIEIFHLYRLEIQYLRLSSYWLIMQQLIYNLIQICLFCPDLKFIYLLYFLIDEHILKEN